MSTYSTNLALELIGTGEQSGTWGVTTNTNLGTLLEQAISGYVTQAITDGSGANTTITIPNGATGVARNMFIEMTGALTFATTSLIVPANKKLYFIYNNTTGGFAVTVKVSGQTGVSVPNGKKVILVSNGTDIVNAENYIASLSVGALTSGRVPYAGTSGLLQDSANLTFNGTTLTAAGFSGPISGVVTSTSITDSGLTSGRVTYASTAGLLTDSSGLTYDGTNLNIGTSTSVTNRLLNVQGSSVAKPVLVQTTTTNSLIEFNDSGTATKPAMGSVGDALTFWPAGVEGMRLTSTGLGIGTTSPSTKLQVVATTSSGAVSNALALTQGGSGSGTGTSLYIGYATTTGTYGSISGFYDGLGTSLTFGTATDAGVSAVTERMRINGAGNVGIGITPSSWGSTVRAEELGTSGSQGAVWLLNNGSLYSSFNNYYNGTNFIYKNSSYATIYNHGSSGKHVWQVAPSGTAGATVSFTEAMTLDNSGNLAIGTTSTSIGKLVSYYTSVSTDPLAPAYAGLNLWGNSSVRLLFGTYSGSPYGAYIQASNTGTGFPIILNPSGGDVGIGTSSPVNKLQVNGAVVATGAAAAYAAGMTIIDYGSGLSNITAIGGNTSTVGTMVFQSFSSNASLGGEKMRIDALGNVGIGITPTNSTNYTTLEISNATNGAIFNLCNGATNKGQVFYDSGGIGVNTLGTARNIRWKAGAISGSTDAHMTLNTSGNLGVGDTSPPAPGGADARVISLQATRYPQFIYKATSASAQSTTWRTIARDTLNFQIQTVNDAISSELTAYEIMRYSGANTIEYQRWYTNTSERMRLDASGNLGIGTSSPGNVLDVSSSGSGEYGAIIRNTSTNGVAAPILRFYAGSGSETGAILRFASTHGARPNELFITNVGTTSPMVFATRDTERMRIDSGGSLLIGNSGNFGAKVCVTFDPSSTNGLLFAVTSGTFTYDYVYFQNSGGSKIGSISSNNSTVAYNTSSDYRLKNTILPMTGALAKVAALKPVTYKWNADDSDGEGFIAHELAEVVPQCVTGEKDAIDEDGKPKYQGVDTSFLIATLTAAIQELNARLTTLENK